MTAPEIPAGRPSPAGRRPPTKRPSAAGRRAPTRSRIVPPILVRQVRNGIEESVHRGDIAEVDVDGRLIHGLGDPDRLVTLRSCVKPFGAVALIEAGGIEAFDLEAPEIAILASSHSGEDLHVRTIQGMYRRAGVSQALIATGIEGMPLDALTAARLARDGEKPGAIRHMCSGQHSVSLLLSRLNDWDPTDYWLEDHPSQVAYRSAVARAFATTHDGLRTAIDGCGLLTYAFPLRDVARAYAFLADPGAVPASDPRAEIAPALTIVRDAMMAHPEMIGGTRDRLDTSLMKALPGRIASKSGMEALRGLAILPGPRASGATWRATGMAIKIEDGDGYDRGTWAASVEALVQNGVLDGQALRVLARYHRPVIHDPHGRVGAEAIPEFDLVPLGELLGQG
ncbi:MAG TPA: asparaginase [Candidatus Limnocylindrales bacterium]|nr:asparaginase [Candidatus Limnocylindrales bacterium]